MNNQGWFPLELIDLISLLSKGLSRVFSSTTVWKHQFLGIQLSLWSNCHIRTWLLKKPQLWLYGPHSTSLTWLLKVLCQKFWGSSRLFKAWVTLSPCMKLQETFLCSKLHCFSLLGLTVLQAQKLASEDWFSSLKALSIFSFSKTILIYLAVLALVAACRIFVVSCGTFCYRVQTL